MRTEQRNHTAKLIADTVLFCQKPGESLPVARRGAVWQTLASAAGAWCGPNYFTSGDRWWKLNDGCLGPPRQCQGASRREEQGLSWTNVRYYDGIASGKKPRGSGLKKKRERRRVVRWKELGVRSSMQISESLPRCAHTKE